MSLSGMDKYSHLQKCVASVESDNAGLPEEQKKKNFPLQVKENRKNIIPQIVLNEGGLEEREDDFNREFIIKLIKKIDWAAFRSGAADVDVIHITKIQIGYTIPETLPVDLNDDVLKNIHHALLELEVMSGKLVCRHCGREYVIEQGIPNMLLREDEVQ